MALSIEIYQCNLPFTKPVKVYDQTLSNRVGILICLTDENHQGWGECCVLSSNPDDLAKFIYEVKEASKALENDEFLEELSKLNISSQVVFACESAVFNLKANKENQNVFDIFKASLSDIPCAALLQGSVDEIIAQVKASKAQGCNTFKLKIGNNNMALDVQKVSKLREVLDQNDKIRLDANGAYEFDDVVQLVSHIGTDQIEFLEDPIKDISRYDELFNQINIPLALDEYVSSQDDVSDGVDVIVIKPSLQGGVLATIDWINWAKKNNKKIIVSSAYESQVGLKMLANLAVISNTSPGLGTWRYLKEDVIDAPFLNETHLLAKDQLASNYQINLSKLEQIHV